MSQLPEPLLKSSSTMSQPVLASFHNMNKSMLVLPTPGVPVIRIRSAGTQAYNRRRLAELQLWEALRTVNFSVRNACLRLLSAAHIPVCSVMMSHSL